MQAALKVINDSLLKGQHLATTLKNANKIVQKEWFRISSTENAQPFEVEDYLDCFEEYSPNLLKYMVNLTDANVSLSKTTRNLNSVHLFVWFFLNCILGQHSNALCGFAWQF